MWTVTIQETLQGFYVNEVFDNGEEVHVFHESFNTFKELIESITETLGGTDESDLTAKVVRLVKKEQEKSDDQEE